MWRHFAIGCVCSAGLVLSSSGQAAPTSESNGSDASAPRPNIVLIMADDMGYGDLSALNPDSKIATPHMDRVAREGRAYTDAHSPSAVCSPTRYGLLTGRYAWRTWLKQGVLWGDSPCLIDPERQTLADQLKAAGYTTACVGKWHLGFGDDPPTTYDKPLEPGPLDLGFDEFFGIAASLDQPPYVYIEGDRPRQAASAEHPGEEWAARYGGPGFIRPGPISEEFKHGEVLDTLTARAVRIVGQGAQREEPFFLYYALTAPHTPWLPSEPFRGKSEAGVYGDYILQIDDAVGQVLRALDRTEQAQDTLVIVTSDNGSHWTLEDIERFEHRANVDWRGQKADIHEGGHRVPFLVRWPGRVPAGSQSAQLTCHTDLFATLSKALELDVPHGAAEDSFDMSADWFGAPPEDPIRTFIVHHSFDGMYALREGPWKLIFGLGSGGFTDPPIVPPEPGGPIGQLYHLEQDPGEQDNLFQSKPQVVTRLEDALRDIILRNRSTTTIGEERLLETTTPRGRLHEDWWRERFEASVARRGDKDRILFLGDSVIQGWETTGKELWEQHFLPLGAVNLGYGADRTQHLLWRIENGEFDHDAEIAVLLIGTNNTRHDTPRAIAAGVQAIVNALHARQPELEIVLHGIFPRGRTSENTLREIVAKANDRISALGGREHVHYIDLSDRFVNEAGEIPEEIMPDEAHLSAAGYVVWADALREELARLK